MKKVFFFMVSALLLAGCSKDLNLPTVEMGQSDIVADKDLLTLTINARVTDQGSSEVLDFGICYTTGNNNHPTVSDPHVHLVGQDLEAMRGMLENVTNGTYYFRAYAVNADGTAYSDIVSYTFAANTYTVTVTAKVIDESTGEDLSNEYRGLISFYNNISYSLLYGETCTVALPPNTVSSPEVQFSHAIWNDGTEGRSHVITSDMSCTMFFRMIDPFSGTYRCTATNVATGQTETSENVTYSGHVFYNFFDHEGLNMKVVGPGLDGSTFYVLNQSTPFTNGGGVECRAILYAEWWEPEWMETPSVIPVLETNILHLAYVGNGRWVLNGGGELSSYDRFFWVIVNDATEEELERTPVYTNLELTKTN